MENKKQLIRCVEFVSEQLDADLFLYSAEITDLNADKLIKEIKQTSPKAVFNFDGALRAASNTP